MEEKIKYSVLEIHARRIRELIESKKYRNPEDFVKTAIEILLTWESSHPEECMELMKSLMPFSKEQEEFMKQSMNSEELQRQFGPLEIDRDLDEIVQQQRLAVTNDDHLKLRDNLKHVKMYVKELRISEPDNIIPYDGYPLLSGFYSRILPVKIVLAVLAHLLERSKTNKVELQKLRVHAFDIAEEIAEKLTKYENERNIPRNEKTSTGLPKKGKKDEEKMTMAQKRFKDQYVGKVRKSRITRANHFEGALSALGLVYAFEEDGKTYVSLTKIGKEFFLIDNPVVGGEYKVGSLTKEESDFIMKKLIPQRELEKRFVDAAITVVKRFHKGTALDKPPNEDYEKITHVIDDRIRIVAIKYLKENPKDLEKYNLNHLESDSESIRHKISQWRLATMGRLSEMGIVRWTINEKGFSEYLTHTH